MAELKGSFSGKLPSFQAGSEAGLFSSGRKILEASMVLCPKDTLTLVNSRFIDIDGNRCVIGYGRGDEINPKDGKVAGQYAVPVHEILGARHAPPTQAKFLETAAVAFEPEFGPEMAVYISRYVMGGGGLEMTMEQIA